ncbi:hypothetical protein LUZ61_015041 [Rhynchospora tenuis]|uniref:BTB domain-containing protein n=1 Tax=Rhynchospora tenuis TaxID=198213 RepID=A0AAD5WC66_9POAL|nr:hypothetical protein LUZ61_015041 [Rhynchospora tenuis]
MKEVHPKFYFNIRDKMGRYSAVHNHLEHTFTSHPSNSDCGFSKCYSTDELETQFCTNGMLDISVNISIVSAVREIDDCSGGLCEDIKMLWRRGERFDVTFQVEGETISAHRFMLAARSPVFEAKLYGPMIEAKSSCIKIEDLKAEVFKALLRFIYTNNFEDSELKYSLDNFLAERHRSAWLKEKCLEFASKSENFIQLAVTEEYLQIMQSFPALFVELRQKVKNSTDSGKSVAKKQKIG